MKFAFSTLATPEWTLEQAVERGRTMGYDGIELRLVDGSLIPADWSAPAMRRVRKATVDAGFPVLAVDTSVRLTEPDTGRVGDEILAYIDMAAMWAAPVVRVFGGSLADDPAGREAALGRAARVLSGAAASAAARGVTVAVETHDDFASSKVVAELLARVPERSIGAVWDSHHPHRMGETAEEVDANLGERLALAQVKDALRDSSERSCWKLVLLGEGEVPVRQLVELVAARGLGWVSVEWEKKWHPEIEPPEVALPQHLAVLREWEAEQ